MEIGMLWYDDSPLALKDRVLRAVGYYREKYGQTPNLCLVHPDMLKADEGRANGVVIRKGKGVMPGHFWIGVDEAQMGNGKRNSKRTPAKSKPAPADATPNAEAAPAATTKMRAPTAAKPKSKRRASSPAKSATKSSPRSASKGKSAAKSSPRSADKGKSAAKSSPRSASKGKSATKSSPRSASKGKSATKSQAKRKERTRAYLKKKSGKRVEKSGKTRS